MSLNYFLPPKRPGISDAEMSEIQIQKAIYSLVDAIEQLDCEEAIYWARYVQIHSTDLKSSQHPKQLELKLPFAQLFKGFDLNETYLSIILVQ